MINDRQYGSWGNRSCGGLLAYVMHVWGRCLERHGETQAVSLDIIKAFDRVWHRGLVKKKTAFLQTSRIPVYVDC